MERAALAGAAEVSAMTTTVVNMRIGGPYDVRIDRKSVWGNPYVLNKHGTRDAVVMKHRVWIVKQPQLLVRLPELEGKRLGCWCKKPDREVACHGDTLVDLLPAAGCIKALEDFYTPEEAAQWLASEQPLLAGERPAWLFLEGRGQEVLALVGLLRSGAYV